MKKPKIKKLKKLTTEQQEIVDQAAQQLAEILVQVIDEREVAKNTANFELPTSGSWFFENFDI